MMSEEERVGLDLARACAIQPTEELSQLQETEHFGVRVEVGGRAKFQSLVLESKRD